MAGVISDSSTLIHLTAIGRLNLLREFYGRVIVPPAVLQEVVTEGASRPGAAEVAAAAQNGWIQVVKPQNGPLLRLLNYALNPGEAEVIALAVELQAELVLLDETEGRRVADVYGLSKTGIIGILIRAKSEGKLSALENEMDALRNQGGFWMSEQLYQRVLQAVGER